MQSLTKDAIEIARLAGLAIMNYFQDTFSVHDKSPDNPVTDADLAADSLLKEGLMDLLPDSGWLSEETVDSAVRYGKKYCWIVDPLDGTKEFVLGIPQFTISVALVDSGRPFLGIVHNPATGMIVHGERGNGVFLDGQPVRVSTTSTFAGSQVDASRSERKRGEFAPFEDLVRLTTMGSIALKLARVACGISDATWSRGPKNEWDICAGDLLIREAGGACVNLDDKRFTYNKSNPKVNGIVATNSHLHNEIIAALAPHRGTARTD